MKKIWISRSCRASTARSNSPLQTITDTRSLLLLISLAAALLVLLATPAQSTAQILGLPDASPAAAGGNIDRALEMFTLNVRRHPESWNVYDSLAEGYANKGDMQKAITNYRKALEMVQDERQKRRIRNELTKLGAGTN